MIAQIRRLQDAVEQVLGVEEIELFCHALGQAPPREVAQQSVDIAALDDGVCLSEYKNLR